MRVIYFVREHPEMPANQLERAQFGVGLHASVFGRRLGTVASADRSLFPVRIAAHRPRRRRRRGEQDGCATASSVADEPLL